MEHSQIGECCIAVGGVVYLPKRAEEKGKGVYIPELFQIRSVGSHTVHFKDHADVLIAYCYLTSEDCHERCLDLFIIHTEKKREEYPI